MVFVQQVLSWFGNSVSPTSITHAESDEEKQCETVHPASDLLPKLNGNSMEIEGFTVPPANDNNGALATVLNPVMSELQTLLKNHHIEIDLKVYPLCCNTGRNNWRCKRRREGEYRYCAKCRKSVYDSGKRRWHHHVIYDSKGSDTRRGFDVDDPDFITPDWVLEQREKQENKCYYCDREMQITRRTAFDGLQAERLTEALPHLKSICVLACGNCNRRSHNSRFCPYPIARARELGFELDEFHFFKGIPPKYLPSRLSIFQENQRRTVEHHQLQE